MTAAVRASSVRFPVDPRDIPVDKAARRLGMTMAEFIDVQSRLFARGFPRPDPDTGRFDLKAIDAWMDQRSVLTAHESQVHAGSRIRDKLNAWEPPVRSNRT